MLFPAFALSRKISSYHYFIGDGEILKPFRVPVMSASCSAVKRRELNMLQD
jgi:hypothetical protein